MGGSIRARIGLFLAGGTYTYQAEIVYGAHEECLRQGFDLICLAGGRLEGVDARSYAYDIASPRDLDAAILVPGTWGAAMASAPVQALLERYAGIHSCIIGARWRDAPSVCIDNAGGVRDLTRHLIEVHQCRRVAFVSGRGLESEERQQGYEAALRDAGLQPDPALFFPGDYSLEAGGEAVARWFGNGPPACDAIVCANDWMAAGALEALLERGVRVPADVSLVGFDDIDSASFMSPALTTIRQPPRLLGREAVNLVGRLLAGTGGERHVSVATVQQIRRSCGCFGHASALRSIAPSRSAGRETFNEARPRIASTLARAASDLAWDLTEGWAEQLVDGLDRDLSQDSDEFFLERLRGLLADSASHGNITAWHDVVSQLREQSVAVLRSDVSALIRAETLFGRAYITIGERAELAQGKRLLERQEILFKLEDVSRAARTALDWPAVCRVLSEYLPRFRIPRCYVATGHLGGDAESRQVFACEEGRSATLPPGGIPFRTGQIVAPEVRADARMTLVVHPMFIHDEVLGYACFEMGPRDGPIFKTLGDLISSALKATLMAEALVAEVTRRERAERSRMRQELDIAARIQTAILPKHTAVSGLELATAMRPATEVGGDYFDVLPCPGGCWIGIGDVAGHGLTAGLVMLMIQSIVAATVYDRPEVTPGQAWRALNAVLSDNVRERMGQEEHATLSLIRYEASGRLRFAGAHEDLIIYRTRRGRCERIPTPGIWVGIGAEISEDAVEERVCQLEPGDVLVLYTDGIIEARAASGEEFGAERLQRVVEAHGDLPVATICERVMQSLGAWMGKQDDDQTLLIVRHTGPAPTGAGP